MEVERDWKYNNEKEEEQEDDSLSDILRDRLRLSAISISQTEARKNGMEIADPIVACLADLSFKYAEQLARDLELFAQHAGRKTVNMEDVILATHRNEHLSHSLRSLCNEIKTKEPKSEKKRKNATRKEDAGTSNTIRILDS